jgi:pyruvate, orthophosphate dikinase
METSPEDVGGMHAAEGILTARGGMTSHAAVVARGWGRPCVCGCGKLHIEEDAKTAKLGDVAMAEGDWICLNGTTGEILLGRQPTKAPEVVGNMAVLMAWADERRVLGVQANCDTPEDAITARKNGAKGIGLVRTEHMFFASAERIRAVRRMIATEELELGAADEAMADLKRFQRADFEGIFAACDGLPVTIRLLDPPLHEFLPKEGAELVAMCEQLLQEYPPAQSSTWEPCKA